MQNYVRDDTMFLSCSYGTLGALTEIGLSRSDKDTCVEVGEAEIPKDFMQKECILDKSALTSGLYSFYESKC